MKQTAQVISRNTVRHNALSNAVRVVSFDLFDTLLLRRCQPELVRFGHIAKAQEKALAGIVPVKAEALYKARLKVHKEAYDRVNRGESAEATHGEIIAALCHQCALPAATGPILARAEIEWECRAVTKNRSLAMLCTELTTTKPVILTSDMYLPAAALHAILQRQLPELASLPLAVSSDVGATKRSGHLFSWLAEHFGVPASTILHIGDNIQADVQMATVAGLQACWVPRSRIYRAILSYRDTRIRQRLYRQGWIATNPLPSAELPDQLPLQSGLKGINGRTRK